MGYNKRIINGTAASDNPIIKNSNAKVNLTGTFKGNRDSFGIDESTLSKHSLFIGGTGCGKTTLFFHFVEQLKRNMTNDDVMIIFDSKGDFYNKFKKPEDLVLGNSIQYRDYSVKWNIFKEILADGNDEKDYLLNIREISNVFFAKLKKQSKDPFFPEAASQIFSSLLLVAIRSCIDDRNKKNEFWSNEALIETLDTCSADVLINMFQQFEDLSYATSYIDENSGAQGLGVISELYSVVKQILIGVFSERGPFSIRDFVRNKGGKTLFIEYDLSIGSVLSPMYSLLIDLALKEALGRTESKNQGNVYLICDEFRLLPNLQHIDDAVNFGRSLGVKVIAGLQSINQLTEVYGQERGKNIAAGFSSVYAFHANDTETRKFVTGLFGTNEYRLQFQKTDGTYDDKIAKGNTVEDWDMTSLNVGEAIVGLPFAKPFRFQFDDYIK